MTINTNTDPYYDDYDASKGYHKILFKPGYAVQARELTQLQTILQEQIARFGDHVFQNGTVVIPGNSSADTSTVYIRIQDEYNTVEVDVSRFLDMEIANQHGVRAVVTAALDKEGSDPKTFYIKYVRGSTDGNYVRFEKNDLIVAINPATNTALTGYNFYTEDSDDFSGIASMANITAGVFYINGKFVYVNKQSVVINKYGTLPHCRVMLKLVESIVDSSSDETLLDPAFGSYNYAAPGADRYKAELVLVAQPYSFTPSDDYIEVMRFNNGVLEEHLRYAKYNELEKNIARRTYDESGDYTVRGIKLSVTDHLNSENFPQGQWSALQGGDEDLLSIKVSSGKAYVKGFEIEKISDTYLSIEKARNAASTRSVNDFASIIEYGQYILITDLVSLPNISAYEPLTIHTTSAPTGGTQIGTARAYGLKLHSGDPDTATAVYALYIFDRSVSTNAYGVGGIRWDSGNGHAAIVNSYVVSNATGNFNVGEIVHFGTTRYGVVHAWNASTSVLQLKKRTTAEGLTSALPIINDTLVGDSSGSTAIIRESISSVVKSPTSLIPLPIDNIKSVQGGGKEITYEVSRRIAFTPTGSDVIVAISPGKLSPKTADNTIARTEDEHVANSRIEFTSDTQVTIDTSGLTGTNGYIIVPVTITNPSLKSKTKTSGFSQTIAAPAGTTFSLSKADVTKLESVTATLVASPYTVVPITSLCTISDFGYRDSYYAPSKITIPSTYASGYTIDVVYEYYAHGAGDFFSIDSYASPNEIGTYKASDGQEIDLAQVLDFRPIIGGGAPLSIEFPRDNSRLFVDLEYYVGRKDAVFLESSGVVRVVSGIPSEVPKLPSTVLEGAMLIATLDIPAYTKYGKDVRVKNIKNRRYTMRDIGKIEDRIAKIEYISALSETEKSVIDMSIINPANGLDRFKSGFLLDGFDVNSPGDVLRDGFAAAYKKTYLTPSFDRVSGTVKYNTSISTPNISSRGGVITLPYNERMIISQPFASRVTNLNPFLVINWNGKVSLNPNFDNWVDTVSGPVIQQAISFNEVINIPQVTINNVVAGTTGGTIVPTPPAVLPTPPTTIVTVIDNNTPTTVTDTQVTTGSPPYVINTLTLTENLSFLTSVISYRVSTIYGTITLSAPVISNLTASWFSNSHGWVDSPNWLSVIADGLDIKVSSNSAPIPNNFSGDLWDIGIGFQLSWTCSWSAGPTVGGVRTIRESVPVTCRVVNSKVWTDGDKHEHRDHSSITTHAGTHPGNNVQIDIFDRNGEAWTKEDLPIKTTNSSGIRKSRSPTTVERRISTDAINNQTSEWGIGSRLK